MVKFASSSVVTTSVKVSLKRWNLLLKCH